MANDQLEDLYEEMYDELRRQAARWLSAHDSVDPASLVHEAHQKLARMEGFESRGHFRAVAAKAMRQILVDRARQRRAQKRGGDQQRVTLTGLSGKGRDMDVLALHAALEDLAELEPRHAQVVHLRFFGGLTVEELADELGVSRSTVESDWRRARAFLATRLRG
jgi:RNA polymerase sigma factor (TIGR02999 family)